MLEAIKNEIFKKKVLILGFGAEGKSTYKLLTQIGGYVKLAISDLNPITDFELNDNIETICGEEYQEVLDRFDIVFKSPGVVLKHDISLYQCKITSQTQIFFSCYRDKIVGITGTKGKSTTTTLIYQILEHNKYDVILAGNIGIPVFDQLDAIKENTQIIVELSSHQLEYMTVSPHIAVLLNIHEEHLDHYGTMEKYVAAKQNIYRYQKESDILICQKDIIPSKEECAAKMIKFLCEEGINLLSENEKITFLKDSFLIPIHDIAVIGEHNYSNIAVAYGICKILGLSDIEFDEGLRAYNPLPHRLQKIGIYDGITYYDDSISTICDTTIQALNSIKDVGTVLIGGKDRGIKYDDLIRFLDGHSVNNIILLEATGARIYKEIEQDYPSFSNKERLHLVNNLKEAVDLAKKITQKGKSCVLSPAAASHDKFKNFEERGRVFAQYIKE